MSDNRLTPLDASFLEVESPSAHMHVGWAALFGEPRGRLRPTFEELRDHVASRMSRAPRYRQKLAELPLAALSVQLAPLPKLPGPVEVKSTVPVGVVCALAAVSVTVAVQVVELPATTVSGGQLTLVEVGWGGVIRPIFLPLDSVNQSAPSGPAAIP